jgi:hypothetical protein
MHMEDLTLMLSERHWHKPYETLWREQAKHGAALGALPATGVLSNSAGKVNKVRREAGKQHGCRQTVDRRAAGR